METKSDLLNPTGFPHERDNNEDSFLINFIKGNYFYVLSACFMLLGCYVLIKSPVTEGTVFFQKLKALLLMQGYELLILATAFILLRRFKVLGDAFTLFLIEITLLLDPTFFTNSFYTMQNVIGKSVLWINVICFVLMILKFVILTKMLKIKIHYQMFAAFVFAGIISYILEEPLTRSELSIDKRTYYYLFGWSAFILALLIPQAEKMFSIYSARTDFISDKQKKSLPGFLIYIPVIVALLHFLETRLVLEFDFRLYYIPPILMTFALLKAKLSNPESINRNISKIDVYALLSVIFSLPALNLQKHAAYFKSLKNAATSIYSVATLPNIYIPLFMTVGVILFVYFHIYFRHHCVQALARLSALFIAGIFYGIYKIQIIPKVISKSENFLNIIGSFLLENSWIIHVFICLAMLLFLYKFRNYFLSLLTGYYIILLIVHYNGINVEYFKSSLIQIVLLYSIIISRLFKDYRICEYIFAVLFMLITFYLFSKFQDTQHISIELSVITVCLLCWFSLRERFYIAGNILQAAFVVLYYASSSGGMMFTCFALMLFGLGIYLSFNKEYYLEIIRKRQYASGLSGGKEESYVFISKKDFPYTQNLPVDKILKNDEADKSNE